MKEKAVAASTYEIFQIEKNGKIVVVTGEDPEGASVPTFDYYESLLSPNITAVMSVMDVGGTAQYDKKFDKQGRKGTLSSALPLTGDVDVRFKIVSKLGTLDFSRNPLIFDRQINPNQESNREAIIMNLVSKAAKENQTNVVKEKYSGNIADIVRKLLKQYLKVSINDGSITPTKNTTQFAGNSKSVFDIVCWLASQSAPTDGNPGYFFYETREGFNFKSIDDLITQKPKEEYTMSGVLRANLDNDDNDYKILLKSNIKSEDLITSLKSGVWQHRVITLDLKERVCKTTVFKFDELKKSLGKEVDVPDTGGFTRTSFHIKSIGTFEKTPAGKVINDPQEWKAKAIMRYNLLFSQVIQIQVPCNPQLVAGDTIICNFETVTQDDKIQGHDPVQSGKYLILNLCHHFNSVRSFTSLTLVRDSYGLYTNKNKK